MNHKSDLVKVIETLEESVHRLTSENTRLKQRVNYLLNKNKRIRKTLQTKSPISLAPPRPSRVHHRVRRRKKKVNDEIEA
jgi:regulator of replication initiation timing